MSAIVHRGLIQRKGSIGEIPGGPVAELRLRLVAALFFVALTGCSGARVVSGSESNPSVQFSATSSKALVTQPVTFSWYAKNATNCTLSGTSSGAFAAVGSKTVSLSTPGSISQTITCTGPVGPPATATITVPVAPCQQPGCTTSSVPASYSIPSGPEVPTFPPVPVPNACFTRTDASFIPYPAGRPECWVISGTLENDLFGSLGFFQDVDGDKQPAKYYTVKGLPTGINIRIDKQSGDNGVAQNAYSGGFINTNQIPFPKSTSDSLEISYKINNISALPGGRSRATIGFTFQDTGGVHSAFVEAVLQRTSTGWDSCTSQSNGDPVPSFVGGVLIPADSPCETGNMIDRKIISGGRSEGRSGDFAVIYYNVGQSVVLGYIKKNEDSIVIPYKKLFELVPLGVNWNDPPTLIGVYVGCEVYGAAVCDFDLTSFKFRLTNP